ncbi:basic amino acid ABC transporter substrate-binding protein [Paludibacterium sp. B53371]|uniref:basic amino acid ABC transporter substrate-binding protein n=1 Tax=Paludibacterium sp. B53371 TaxID=2806263 RepID=UPI001C05138A|nr:basic amino acid ABC transporter substrate-binding protein [Paludibacterium sp. B53371]
MGINLFSGWRVLVTLAFCFLLAACDRGAGHPDAAAVPVYVVGSDASYPPFESMDEHQNMVGFDVDLLRAIARREGFRLQFVNTPWEGIFATLGQRKRDILASAISISQQRMKQVDFSEPYFSARQVIAVPRGANEIGSFADLRGIKVAVQVGTSADEDLQRLLGKESGDVVRYQTMTEAFAALKAGKVGALVGDNGVVAGFVRQSDGAFFVVQDTASFAPEHYGFAVAKGQTALRDKLNAGLAAVRADGTYDRLYRQYFAAGK